MHRFKQNYFVGTGILYSPGMEKYLQYTYFLSHSSKRNLYVNCHKKKKKLQCKH